MGFAARDGFIRDDMFRGEADIVLAMMPVLLSVLPITTAIQAQALIALSTPTIQVNPQSSTLTAGTGLITPGTSMIQVSPQSLSISAGSTLSMEELLIELQTQVVSLSAPSQVTLNPALVHVQPQLSDVRVAPYVDVMNPSTIYLTLNVMRPFLGKLKHVRFSDDLEVEGRLQVVSVVGRTMTIGVQAIQLDQLIEEAIGVLYVRED